MSGYIRTFIAGLLVAAAGLIAPAAAFDNTTCQTFLVGKWTMKGDREISGKKAHYEGHSVYGADGMFTRKLTMTLEGMPQPQMIEQAGKWSAKPGPAADSCSATVSPDNGAEQTVVLTVVDDHTVKGPDGSTATRE